MKRTLLYILGGIFTLLVVIGIFSSESEKSELQNLEQDAENSVPTKLVDSETLNTTGETSLANPSLHTQKTYEVVKVVDGDTVDVSIDGKTERLRLIGIDTPEIMDPRKPVECFGVEASNKAKTLLTDKKVFLESDNTQGERDKYDRLLRYVFLEDGINFNLLMIEEGYAHEYTYSLPYKYQTQFKSAQIHAREKNKGLWSSNACNGLKTVAPSTEPELIPIPKSKPAQTSSQCNPNYSGCLKKNAGDYDCASGSGDGPNYTGTVQVLGYDEYKLDRDGDGWACES